MKSRPIIFSAPMVRAILEGRKTQERRVVKPQPEPWAVHPQQVIFCGIDFWEWTDRNVDGDDLRHWPDYYKPMRCPYGQPGDQLWVKEAWRVAECYGGKSGSELAGFLSARNIHYEAVADQFLGKVVGRYRHARFMPRWASRITLEITGVRVERLQAISYDDAVAEGIEHEYPKAFAQYRELWESIHGPGSWDANPWVWVVEFRKLEEQP